MTEQMQRLSKVISSVGAISEPVEIDFNKLREYWGEEDSVKKTCNGCRLYFGTASVKISEEDFHKIKNLRLDKQ